MITILQLAESRGLKKAEDGSSTMGDFANVNLELIGGCARCGACIAAYNAFPSRIGYWLCEDCIGPDEGFETPAEFEAFVQENAANLRHEAAGEIPTGEDYEEPESFYHNEEEPW